ncbi:hypothetical protein SRHO_G00270420 [Serrasalmus rhombeus]
MLSVWDRLDGTARRHHTAAFFFTAFYHICYSAAHVCLRKGPAGAALYTVAEKQHLFTDKKQALIRDLNASYSV